MTDRFFVRNVEHLEEKSKILNVIGVIVIVYSEPEHSMRFRILVSNNALSFSGRNQDGGRKGSSAFWGHQTQVIVTLCVTLFQLIQIFNTLQTECFHLLLDIIRNKIGNVLGLGATLLVSRNQVIGFFANKFTNSKRNRRLFLLVISGKSSDGQRSLDDAPTGDARYSVIIIRKRKRGLTTQVFFIMVSRTQFLNSTHSIYYCPVQANVEPTGKARE
jgi:hypothetical protein